jgi:2-iminoacetate synthase
VNALSTFIEYLEDYGSPETKAIGAKCVEEIVSRFSESRKQTAQVLMKRVQDGERDVFV